MMTFLMRIAWVCFILGLSVVGRGQDRLVPFSDFLKETLSNSVQPEDELPERKITDFVAPVLENIKIRSETDRFDIHRQQYEIRFSPSTPQIRRYQNQLYDNLKKEFALEKKYGNAVNLREHYDSWIDKYLDYRELRLTKKLLPIHHDLVTIGSKEEKDGSVDLLQLVEFMQDQDDQIAHVEYLRGSCCSDFRENAKTKQDPISVKAIEEMILGIQLEKVAYQGIEVDQFEIEKLETEYELEKAEKERIFDFAEMSYRGPVVKPWEERVALRVGLRLPFSGESSLDMAELEIEKLIEEEQINQRLDEAKSEFLENKTKVISAIEEYRRIELLEQSHKKYDVVLKDYAPKTKKEIIDFLKIKKKPIERSIDHLRALRQVYREYIKLIDELDLLSKKPFVNYLSPLFEPIQMD